MSVIRNFTNLYSLSKTLKFNLKPYIPEGMSEEEKNRFIDDFWSNYLAGDFYKHDAERDESYPIVKELLDIFHRRFINDVLSGFECNPDRPWQNLFVLYATDKKAKAFKDAQKKMREDVAKCFTSHEWWKNISSYKEMIETIIPRLVQNDDDYYEEAFEKLGLARDVMLQHLDRFKSFSVYFTKFKENRDNIYKKDDQATSIANRIVNENFPKFADNIIVFNRLKEVCPEKIAKVQDNLSHYLQGKSLDEVFTAGYFNECLTQKGIEKYNWILGGNPNEDVLGVNSIGNDYVQHTSQPVYRLKELKMTMLYKQILSDRIRLSFLPEQFAKGREGELQLIDAVDQFSQQVIKTGLLNRIMVTLGQLTSHGVNLNQVYVVGNKITELSKLLYGSWNVLGEEMRKHQVTGNSQKAQTARNQDISEWIEKKEVSVADILSYESGLLSEHTTNLTAFLNTFSYNKWDKDLQSWIRLYPIVEFQNSYVDLFLPLKERILNGASLSSDENAKKQIKSYLDKFMDILHVAELFRLGKKAEILDKDSFYIDYDSLFVSSDDALTLSDIIPLYNKVRSFLTRKVKDEGKMLLKFDSPTRANGWKDCAIVSKDNNYYLVLFAKTLLGTESISLYSGNTCKIMEYTQQKVNFANNPRVFIYSKGSNRAPAVTKYQLPIETIESEYNEYKNCEDKSAFLASNPTFQNRLIDYYKIGLSRHEDYSVFHSTFLSSWKPTEEYLTIKEFNEHTQSLCYSLTMREASFQYLLKLQAEQKIYIMQIYNKDFAEGAHGTPNMHTLYWKELFSEENSQDVVYKLASRGIEFFYRRKAIGSPYKHARSSVLVNKTFADGTPVSPQDYLAFVKYFNGEKVDLTDEQKCLLPQVKTNRAKIDIVKDKRYTEPKFMFHVPITINFKAQGIKSEKEFNNKVLNVLRANKEEVNIIGIDRGERNLIYVSVINRRGENVIPPRHFNVIETATYDNLVRKYNYLEKLKQIEGNRDEARKNWTAIENIKELKSGYLSQVVHEISKLVVQYNAIIVLEDLNFGFKRGRFNVERQVYQKFEEMLIKKLNYLVFKKDSPSAEYGNIRNGLQLTAPFTSFKDLGKQSGWLFYVPAEYTSKIDPQTGFVNLFNMKKAELDPKAFFKQFTSIEYRDGLFYFTFDYRNLPTVKTDYQNIWTLSSHGERIASVLNRDNQRREQQKINLTEEIKSVFAKECYNVEFNTISKDVILNHAFSDALCKDLFYKFKLLLQMRNSVSNTDVDYLISPVAGEHPFHTSSNTMGITDADANGAYHIALKGLFLLQNDFPMDGDGLKYITTAEWLEFVQKHEYRND